MATGTLAASLRTLVPPLIVLLDILLLWYVLRRRGAFSSRALRAGLMIYGLFAATLLLAMAVAYMAELIFVRDLFFMLALGATYLALMHSQSARPHVPGDAGARRAWVAYTRNVLIAHAVVMVVWMLVVITSS